ncbi:MAG TPA: TonB-dependent receptor [Candidatus Sulfotelmatobacter sp.]|nr:TonB-dependent receptor [Candidatus Sulfotelmatobacter sp.]
MENSVCTSVGRKTEFTAPVRFRFCASALALLCLFFLWGTRTSAQLTTADIVGTVTDPSGAVLPNAKITVESLATHEARSTETTSAGDYDVAFLLPGHYSIRVEVPGFKVFTVADLTLSVGDRARVDAKLEVGSSAQTVEVAAQSPLLQSESSTISSTIGDQLVQDLPLPTRNLTSLVVLTPGANEGPSLDSLSSGQRPDDRRQNSSFTVNSEDVELNNEQIDGTDNNERIIGTIGVKPPIDAIQEVTVQTNNYTPESGRTPGGLVTVVTKSGGNAFHGSAYEFFQNDALSARNPFDVAPNPKSELRQNDFGVSIGGPIIHDRTFFFFAWEGFRQVTGVASPIFSSVPTAAEQALGPAGIVAADPAIPAGTPVDPIAANLFKLYPMPNTGPAGSLVNNFVFDPNKTQFSNAFDARVDHRFNESNVIFARFTSNNVSSVIPTNLPSVTINNVLINPGNGQFGFAGPAKDIAYNAQLNYTHIFSPALLLELKAAYTLIDNTSNSPNSGTNAATAVGFPSNINFGPLDSSGLPLINMAGTAPLGDSNFVPIVDISNTFEENGAISYTRGSHSIKAGVEVIRRQARNVQSSNGVGNINFGLPEDSGSTPQDSINNLATFLVGAFVSEGRNTDLETPNYRSWETGFYAQDTWKVRPWLTVNYGARYDIFTPFTEAHGFLSNFDPATNQLLVPAAGLRFLTNEGADTTGIVASSATAGLKTTYSNIGPRVGFAATVAPGTVLRGGFGIAYFPGNYTSNASLKNAPFNGIYAPSIGGTPCISPLAHTIESEPNSGVVPLPACSAAQGQTTTLGGPTGGLPVPTPQALNSADLSLPDNVALNFRTSYVEQFNLMLQKQFGENVLSVGYVGQLGRHLPQIFNDINVPDPLTTPHTAANTAGFGKLNTINGQLCVAPTDGCDLRFTVRPLATLFPGLGSVGEYVSGGTSSYNSLQVAFQRRFHRGLTVTANYVYSHAIDDAVDLSLEGQQGFGNADPFDLKRFETGNSDLDLRHRFVAAATYELPFGRDLTGAKKIAFGGWQTSGIFIWNSGTPFSITDNFTGFSNSVYNGIGGGPTRPDIIANPGVPNPSNSEFFNRDAFQIPTLGLIGTDPRNNLYGPHLTSFAFSVFKNFSLTERFTLQFRTEIFNLTNTPDYFIPNNQNDFATTNATPTAQQIASGTVNPGFAQIVVTNPDYTPRRFQFALKLLF